MENPFYRFFMGNERFGSSQGAVSGGSGEKATVPKAACRLGNRPAIFFR